MKRLGLRLHADEEHWIPLSDLMTGLMFLFLLVSLAYMVQIEMRQSRPKDVLQAYTQTRAQLAADLEREFSPDLSRWGAALDPNTLGLRFYARNVLFAPGSAELQPRFKAILDDFFPRYVRILEQPRYRDVISELRVEGYTSSFWRPGASADESYIGNMALSQDRARAVLSYVLTMPQVRPSKPWLMHVLTANGLSSSHPIRRADGSEDAQASQRVEFGVRTNAEAQVRSVLALTQPSPPAAAGTAPVVVADSMPAYPAWAAAAIGKPLHALYPKTSTACLGFLDGAAFKYVGPRSGDKLFGWAYDTGADAPVLRVLFADARGTIVGAGDGGVSRPDVPAKLARIASPLTGWEGYAAASGPVAAWAVLGSPGTVCRLEPSRASSGNL
jgi:outer membrane protein OmpA-like peptidoglycan-associated protein